MLSVLDQAAGDEVVTVDGPAVAVFFHGHLRDRRVHVTRGGVAAEAEVAEAVENIAAVVGFHFLQNVRVRAENDVRARVNGRVSEGFLIGSHLVAALRAQCGAKIRISAPASLSFSIPAVMLLLLRPVHPGQ